MRTFLLTLLALWACDASGPGDDHGPDTAGDSAAGEPDQDLDGYGVSEDCDDADPAVNPGAREVCNGVDDDCDGVVDGADAAEASPWYPDLDGDGYGDAEAMVRSCEAPEGYIPLSGDCDDADPAEHPWADEWCDGDDDDCDGEVDEPHSMDASLWYADADGDGYGLEDDLLWACPPGSGYSAVYGDCDDADASVHPGAAEVADLRDQDCDVLVDEDFLEEGDLVITEIMKDPSLAGLCACNRHDADWFEVWNGRDDEVRLDGWTVTDEAGHAFRIAPDARLGVEPGGYVVLCNRHDYFASTDECDYEWSDLFWGDGYYDIDFVLDSGDGLVSLAAGELAVDVVDWESYAVADEHGHHWPAVVGYAMQLDIDVYFAAANDDAGWWCTASPESPFGHPDLEYYPNYGTPGADNTQCD